MEYLKIFKKDGKLLNLPGGLKIIKMFLKDGDLKNVPEGWKIGK